MSRQVLINNVVKRHIIRLASIDAIRESKKYKTASAGYVRSEITPEVLEVLGNHLFYKTAFIKDITSLYENTKNSLIHIYEEIQKKPNKWEEIKKTLNLDPKNIGSMLMDLPNFKSNFGKWLESVIKDIPFLNIMYKVSKLEYTQAKQWLENLYAKLPAKIQQGIDKLKNMATSVKDWLGKIWDLLKEKIKKTDNKAVNIAVFLVYLGISRKIDDDTFAKKNLVSGLTGKLDSDQILDDLPLDKLSDFISALLEDFIDIEDIVKYKTLPFQIYFLYQEGYLDEELRILKGH